MRRVLMGALAVVALVGLSYGGYVWSMKPYARVQEPATPQEVPSVDQSRGPEKSIFATGVVVPAQSAELSLPTGGTVAEVLVVEGDRVEAGQLLLQLDAAQQRAAVSQAEARLAHAQAALARFKADPREEEVAAAKAVLAAAQAALQKLRDGAGPEEIEVRRAALRVAEAELARTLGANKSQLISAQVAMKKAERAVQQAQAAYDRVAHRGDIAALPESLQLEQATLDYEAAKAQYETLLAVSEAEANVARARVAQAQAALAQVEASPRFADLATAQAEVDRAQAQLDLLLAGAHPEEIAAAEADVIYAQATLAQARAALAKTELRAPFAGTVVKVGAKEGEVVGMGEPLIIIADLNRWQVEANDVKETDIGQVIVGQKVEITVEAFPKNTLRGQVVGIALVPTMQHGDVTYIVTVSLNQGADIDLRWGMTARLEIPIRAP